MQYVSRDGQNKDEEVTFTASEMEHLISEYVTGRKAERNREILWLHFIGGYTLEEIGGIEKLSTVQVWRIVHRYGDRLLLMLKK